MLEIGVVEKVDDKNKTAKIKFPRKEECEKCGMCLKHKNEMTVSILVKNKLNARVGDRVAVGMKDGFVLRAAFIVYIIPLLLVGLVVGLGRDLNELLLFGLITAALAVGVAISVFADRLIRKKGVAVPIMTEIVEPYPYADLVSNTNTIKDGQETEQNKEKDVKPEDYSSAEKAEDPKDKKD